MAKKEKEVVEIEGAETDADHAELRVYELGFHLDPELSNDEMRKTFDGVRAAIEKAGTVVAVGEPQKIPLAYTVSRSETGGRRDFDSSFFAWISYEADGAGHDKVKAFAEAETRIFRYLDVRTTKEEAKHFSEMQELLARAPEPATTEDEVKDEELDQALKEVGV
jgi:ribosomal protein S6